jgi:hypothetical protein
MLPDSSPISWHVSQAWKANTYQHHHGKVHLYPSFLPWLPALSFPINQTLQTMRGRFLLAMLLAVCVLLAQTWDGLVVPQFWAEDCLVFFAGAHSDGLGALLQPYAGYWHLAPRLAALLADQVPVLHAPLVLAIMDLVLRVLALGVMAMLIPHRGLAFLLLASVLLVPQTGETLGNVTSAQWHLAFVLLGVLMMAEAPATTFGRYSLLLVIVVAALSTPLIVALAPLFLLKLYLMAYTDREQQGATGYVYGILAVLLGVACLQVVTAALSYEYDVTAAQRLPALEILVRMLGRITDPWSAFVPRSAYSVPLLLAMLACLSSVLGRGPVPRLAGVYLALLVEYN